MKQLLSFFLLFICANCYCQQIELHGRYGASFIGGESIEFIGKDSFYFDGFYCTNGVSGKGRCEIRNNYLYLFFEKSKTSIKTDSLKPMIITKTATVDSIAAIQITILDNNDIPIPYAAIDIESDEHLKIAVVADTTGRAIIKIKNSASIITIKTAAVGINPRYLKLEGGYNYNIKLFHQQNNLLVKELNNGEIFVYEIDELSEELILMRPQKSSEQFRKYIKKRD